MVDRYVCTRDECGIKSFQKKVSFVEPRSKYTCRFQIALFELMLKESADTVARELDGIVSNATAADIFKHVVKIIDKAAPDVWATPHNMGIHIVGMKSTDAFLVTNIDEECAIDFLEDCSPDSLRKLSKRFKRPNDIKVIWVDLYEPLINAVREVFPDAEIRIGEYQLTRYTDRLLREVIKQSGYKGRHIRIDTLLKDEKDLSRKTQIKLDEFLAENAEVRRIYELRKRVRKASHKELLDIVDSLVKDQPYRYYGDFLALSDALAYKDIITSSFHEIMESRDGNDLSESYFPYQDDAIAGVLDVIRNCSFDVLRARALYASLDYGIALEMSYRNREYLASLETDTSELTQYGKTTVSKSYFMKVTNSMSLVSIGTPLRDMAARLSKYGTK